MKNIAMKNLISDMVICVSTGALLAACGGSSSNGDAPSAAIQKAMKSTSAACYPAWSGSNTYVGGNPASENGVNYTAAYWTLNNDPATSNNGPSAIGGGQPWNVVGACSGEPTSTPPPPQTPPPTDGCIAYAAGTAYAQNQVVSNADGYYRCDVSGWCSSTASSYYAPGAGWAWTSAWTQVTSASCSDTPTQTPTPTDKIYPPAALGGSVAGWPAYIAMGAVGGPNASPPTATSTGGNDDFGGRPVDVVFKYAGVNGDGDPGVIDPPTNAYRMTNDFNVLSALNNHATRIAIVEYTAQMSGGENFGDFTNTTAGAYAAQPTATYLMARHFSSLASDAIMLAAKPVTFNGASYYGSLIMNPDLLGAIQQNNYIGAVNSALPAGAVNTAVAQAMCFLTTSRSYTNTSDPNGAGTATYIGKTYTGNPVQILKNMLDDGYPEWSFDGANDPYWNSALNNYSAANQTNSQVGTWFNTCIANPAYDTTAYPTPNFPAGFEGWVEANNWLVRTFAAKGTVTIGWQENMWAIGSGFWLHKNLTDAQIAATYATPVSTWLNANAPGTITPSATGGPDYFLFDRYEMDDSAAPGAATLYNARSWDNFLIAVGQVSQANHNIPIMLWQIPGSHIANTSEAAPELFANTSGAYTFSTAPVYFFGDSNLNPGLSNIILGSGGSTNANTSVGNFMPACGATAYNCLTSTSTYQQYLLEYQSSANNFNWSIDNGKRTLAANSNVFAILWGGGNTTNVIKNFSNTDDHGWLANKIINYYTNSTPVVIH